MKGTLYESEVKGFIASAFERLLVNPLTKEVPKPAKQ